LQQLLDCVSQIKSDFNALTKSINILEDLGKGTEVVVEEKYLKISISI